MALLQKRLLLRNPENPGNPENPESLGRPGNPVNNSPYGIQGRR